MYPLHRKHIQLVSLVSALFALALQSCGLSAPQLDIESQQQVSSAPHSVQDPGVGDLAQPLLGSNSYDRERDSGSQARAVQTAASKQEVKILLDNLRMQHGEKFWECRLQLPSKSRKQDSKLETGSVDTRITQRTHRTTDQDCGLEANYVTFKYYVRPTFQHSDPIRVIPYLRIYQWQTEQRSFTYVEPPFSAELSTHPAEIFYRQKSCAAFLLSEILNTFIYHFELIPDLQQSHYNQDNPALAPFSVIGLLKHDSSDPKFVAYSPNKLNILQTGTISGKSIGSFQGSIQNEVFTSPGGKILELQQELTEELTEDPDLGNNDGSESLIPTNQYLDTFKCIRRIALSRPLLVLATSGVTFLLCKSYCSQK